MFSTHADAAAAKTVSAFVKEAIPLAHAEGVAEGMPRHAALQDTRVLTKAGQRYDSFIRHSEAPFDIEQLPASRFLAMDDDG